MTFAKLALSLMILNAFALDANALAQQTPANGAYGPEPLPSPYGTNYSAGPYPASPQYGAPQYAAPQSPAAQSAPQFQYSAPPANQYQTQQTSVWNTLARARQLVRTRQPEQALPLIDEFIQQRPLEPEGYFWRGVALDNMNRTNEALPAFEKGIEQVLRAHMDSAELRMNAANTLLKLGRTDDAIVQYRRAVQIDPSLGLAQLNLGRALIEKGDSTGALQCFERCETLNFKPYQLDYYKAKALLKAGRTDEAHAQAQTCLSKIPPGATHDRVKNEFAL